MTYNQTLRQSLIIIIVGIACLVIGFTAGHGNGVNVTGLQSASANQSLESPVPSNNF